MKPSRPQNVCEAHPAAPLEGWPVSGGELQIRRSAAGCRYELVDARGRRVLTLEQMIADRTAVARLLQRRCMGEHFAALTAVPGAGTRRVAARALVAVARSLGRLAGAA